MRKQIKILVCIVFLIVLIVFGIRGFINYSNKKDNNYVDPPIDEPIEEPDYVNVTAPKIKESHYYYDIIYSNMCINKLSDGYYVGIDITNNGNATKKVVDNLIILLDEKGNEIIELHVDIYQLASHETTDMVFETTAEVLKTVDYRITEY